MKRLSLKEIVHLVLYYKNHNVDETLREFGVSKSSLFRYVRKYDGTEASLIDGRTNPKKCVPFTEEEEKRFLDSLQVYNSPKCERYVIVPSYSEVYCAAPEYKGTRTYWEVANWARKLLSVCIPLLVKRKKESDVCTNRAERRKYHAAKKPGILQIDMMYIPLECYSEAMRSPENLTKLQKKLINEARRETEAVVKAYKVEAQDNPQLKNFLIYSCKEAWKDFQKICDDVMKCTAEDLLPRRFYQYTAVDEYSGWAYRQIYITHSEASAMLFMAEVMKHAPYKIVKVQTDNGSEFTSKYLKNHGPDYETPFEQYLRIASIKYYRIQLGKPWQNGRVECQHRLDRERFYRRIQFSSLEEAQNLLKKYNEESNHYYRPSRGGKSAMEQLMEYQKGDAK